MRTAIWNIQQGGGNRIDGIASVLASVDADLRVLSEYTTPYSEALISALKRVGLEYVLHTFPELKWGGLLVASRSPISVGLERGCPNKDRWLHVLGPDLPFEIGAAYIPNRERSPREKREYWDWLLSIGPTLLERPFLICGDLNTALSYVDQEANKLPSADALREMLAAGWIDVWRTKHEGVRESSWWSHHKNGFRLDYALASTSAAPNFTTAEYLIEVDRHCVVHQRREHSECTSRPLSDHAMLVVDTT